MPLGAIKKDSSVECAHVYAGKGFRQETRGSLKQAGDRKHLTSSENGEGQRHFAVTNWGTRGEENG